MPRATRSCAIGGRSTYSRRMRSSSPALDYGSTTTLSNDIGQISSASFV